jgi:hypothetical protein
VRITKSKSDSGLAVFRDKNQPRRGREYLSGLLPTEEPFNDALGVLVIVHSGILVRFGPRVKKAIKAHSGNSVL